MTCKLHLTIYVRGFSDDNFLWLCSENRIIWHPDTLQNRKVCSVWRSEATVMSAGCYTKLVVALTEVNWSDQLSFFMTQDKDRWVYRAHATKRSYIWGFMSELDMWVAVYILELIYNLQWLYIYIFSRKKIQRKLKPTSSFFYNNMENYFSGTVQQNKNGAAE